MKSILLFGIVLGLAVIGSAQISPPPSALRPCPADTPVGVVTDDATSDADGVLRHANKPKITIGTVQITADDADFNRATGEYVLHGDIRILTGRTR